MGGSDARLEVVLLVALLLLAGFVLWVPIMSMIVVMVVAVIVALIVVMLRFAIFRGFIYGTVGACFAWYTRTATVRSS